MYVLQSAIRTSGCDVVINVFDGGRNRKRLDIHPDYKGGRVQSLDFDKESF